MGTGPHPGTTKLRQGREKEKAEVRKPGLVPGLGNTSNHPKCREEGPGRAKEGQGAAPGEQKKIPGPCSFWHVSNTT